MLALFKKIQKAEPNTKLLYNPVYDEEILGALYQKGELIGHARMRTFVEEKSLLVGVTMQGFDSVFFVATHQKIIDHINRFGCVPMIQTHNLRFFKDKKRMNGYLAKCRTQVA